MKVNPRLKVTPVSTANYSRPWVKVSLSDLLTAYAINVLTGVADIESSTGTVRYVVDTGGNYYAVSRRNAPSASALRFPVARYDNAAEVALRTLATL